MIAARRGEPVLRVTDLTKRYGSIEALAGLTMRVERGEATATQGRPSGETSPLRVSSITNRR